MIHCADDSKKGKVSIAYIVRIKKWELVKLEEVCEDKMAN